jgi:3-dehydroquinate synthetase/predicted NBD/HSP70 family sugar kinase
MNEFPACHGNGDEIVTFDLGGTSFRSARLTREGYLADVQRLPSINYRSLPGSSAAAIVEEIAAYIARVVQSFSNSQMPTSQHSAIAISMGAALNAHTGTILGSGPILGESGTAFDLKHAIRRCLPDANVTIVNDVTASLIAHASLPRFRHARQLALITVSTGIAARKLNCSIPHVPVDPVLGTQGEIGHHRIAFSLAGHRLSLRCDCGGVDHLNAFASGNGIKRVLAQVREIFPQEFRASHLYRSDPTADAVMYALVEGLVKEDALCQKLLMAVTAPVAEAIKWHFMLDPEIDKLILTGGVCFLLQDYYRSAILEHLKALEFYPLTSDTAAFWADRVVLGPRSDDVGLIGAAYLARESPTIHRQETLTADPPYRVSRHHATDYQIHVVNGILQNESFPEGLLDPFERIILVADATVNEIYGDALRNLLAASDRSVETIVLRASEKQKDLLAVTQLVSSFENLAVSRRKDLIVAAGGGITLDIVGFATNIFRRGVPCLRIPTTLLGAIDAGIGLKNAVNFRQSKNRLGTYSAPYAVVVDPQFLATLSDRQARNGLSEALKIAVVADRTLYELIEEHARELVRTKLQSPYGTELIHRAIQAMLLELAPNLHERILGRFPDYGHTFSPRFEFELSDLEHGEAVALDMAFTTALAGLLGILDFRDAERILVTQHVLGLPIFRPGMTLEMLTRGICDARKHRGGKLQMPILRGIGEAMFIDEVSNTHLEQALAFIQTWSGPKDFGARRRAEGLTLPSHAQSPNRRPSIGTAAQDWRRRRHSLDFGGADA